MSDRAAPAHAAQEELAADAPLRRAALDYHAHPPAGKLSIVATKPLTTQRDLSLAYSPGVAAACEAIAADPAEAARLTARGNLVAVITNGTAVLGLGNIGPLAGKPVMEGKAILFKKFAGIDSIDIEINEEDPEKLIEVIAALEPSFGAINLEDIKAPEAFRVEEELIRRMRIPVFHDDQHGTAIIVAAAIVNWLELTGRRLEEVRLVSSGAGASAIATLNLLSAMGMARENITITDRKGVVWEGREPNMEPNKARYAISTNARTLGDALTGADIFLGLSGPGTVRPAEIASMGERPLVLALANPTPEILPELVREVRPDAIIATGRSDYPNQVNNVLCFPFIFRGALDVGATEINLAMKIACVHAIARLARSEISETVANVYANRQLVFGLDYLIPTPFDPRLIVEVPTAVARAAMESGVATRPIADWRAYRGRLSQFVFKTGLAMRPVFDRAQSAPARIAYAEGEEERVLRACQTIVDEGLGRPTLIGRPEIIRRRIERLSLRLETGRDVDLVDIDDDPRFDAYWQDYHSLMERRGTSPQLARRELRTNPTVVASMMVRRGDVDAMVCGTVGRYPQHLQDVVDVLGLRPGVSKPYALSLLVLQSGSYFVCDTYVTAEPTPEQLAEMTVLAAEEVRRFGLVPKVALVSHSSFGTHDDESARTMRRALELIGDAAPELEVEGEMHADAALSEEIRMRIFPNSRLRGQANLLVMPSLAAANIAFNTMKVLGDGISVGPLLMGVARPAHIVTPSVTARGIVNVSALASVEAHLATETSQIGYPIGDT